MIDEGELLMSRCVNCGQRHELALLPARYHKPKFPLLDTLRDVDGYHQKSRL